MELKTHHLGESVESSWNSFHVRKECVSKSGKTKITTGNWVTNQHSDLGSSEGKRMARVSPYDKPRQISYALRVPQRTRLRPGGPAARVTSPPHETQRLRQVQSGHEMHTVLWAIEPPPREGDGGCSRHRKASCGVCWGKILLKKQGINLYLDLNLLVTSIHFTSGW